MKTTALAVILALTIFAGAAIADEVAIGWINTDGTYQKWLVDRCKTVFFLVEYEAYEWNPCSNGTCLSIDCGGPLCKSPPKQFFVKTIEEVRQLVDRNGTDHLGGMYHIEWDGETKSAAVIELKLVPSFEIKQKEKTP